MQENRNHSYNMRFYTLTNWEDVLSTNCKNKKNLEYAHIHFKNECDHQDVM